MQTRIERVLPDQQIENPSRSVTSTKQQTSAGVAHAMELAGYVRARARNQAARSQPGLRCHRQLFGQLF